MPRSLRLPAVLILLLGSALLLNFVYQAVRKPSELLFPVSGALIKSPAQTWRSYGAAFRRYSTATVSPQLLAALAQTEASGDPMARTYWRWEWNWHPLEIYRPASSAVGMYQMTDGTFAQAKQLCVQDHRVRRVGDVSDWPACWSAFSYSRVVPEDAIQLTSAYLDQSIHELVSRNRMTHVSPQQTDGLAAVIHLCGIAAADQYAKRGFRLLSGERCGTQDPRRYLKQVKGLESTFTEWMAAS